jgi:hypothetical protein
MKTNKPGKVIRSFGLQMKSDKLYNYREDYLQLLYENLP